MKCCCLLIVVVILSLHYSCNNKQQPINHASTNSLIVGKWTMVEYGGGSVNALDTISFYENGKMDYPFETGEFTYRFITSDSLIVYNCGFGEVIIHLTYHKSIDIWNLNMLL